LAAARKADAALAFDRAASYYKAALELTPESPASVACQEALAAALANAGRPSAAADAYLAAAQIADSTRRVEFHRRAAEQFLLGGHIDRGLDTIRSVLEAVGLRLPAGPRQTLAALATRRAQLRWRGFRFAETAAERIPSADLLRIDTCWSVASGLALVDSLRAAHFQTRCLLLALDAGEPYRIARSMAAEAGFSAFAGRRSQRSTTALAERARTLAAATGHPHAIALASLMNGVSAFMLGRWRESIERCDQALEMLRRYGMGVFFETVLAERILIGSLMYAGRIREVSDRIARLLDAARANGNVYWDTELRTGHAFVWLARDAPDEAVRQADDGIASWSHDGFHRQHYNHVLAHVQAELYRGRARQAWQQWEANWPAIKRSLLLRIQWTRIEVSYWRARSALLVAAASRARRFHAIARRDAFRIRRERMPWSDPVAFLISAAVAHLEGDSGTARRQLLEAAKGFDRAGMKLHAAVARRRFGELTGDQRGREYCSQSDAWMSSEGIVNPTRMTRLIAPGFADPPGT
jgi:tetratricopeptide (TPR) repeat protein